MMLLLDIVDSLNCNVQTTNVGKIGNVLDRGAIIARVVLIGPVLCHRF